MANGLVGLPRRGLQHGVSRGVAKKLWIKNFHGQAKASLDRRRWRERGAAFRALKTSLPARLSMKPDQCCCAPEQQRNDQHQNHAGADRAPVFGVQSYPRHLYVTL